MVEGSRLHSDESPLLTRKAGSIVVSAGPRRTRSLGSSYRTVLRRIGSLKLARRGRDGGESRPELRPTHDVIVRLMRCV